MTIENKKHDQSQNEASGSHPSALTGSTPFYCDDHVSIYLGDCRELLPQFSGADALITDPVWPNATADLYGKEIGRASCRERV